MDYLSCIDFFNYYLSLENDCYRTEAYVAFHENNFHTFSIEYAKLLLSICCEVETVLKKICYEIQPENNYTNIAQYKKCIIEHFINFTSEAVLLKSMNYTFSPWSAWKDSGSPKWWKDYTVVKHKRADADAFGQLNFHRANQENVLEALSALYVAEQYLLLLWESKNNRDPKHMSQVLDIQRSQRLLMNNWRYCYESFMGNAWVNLSTLYKVVGLNNENQS